MHPFERGMVFVLKAEGGWYDGKDARDRNPTMMGITQKTYNAYLRTLKPKKAVRSVRNIDLDEVDAIYRILYWTKGKCEDLAKRSDTVAIIHFDACVNHGVASPNNDASAGAIELLQRTLGVVDDGIFGPITWENYQNELMEDGEVKLACRYLEVRKAQYEHLAHRAPHTLGVNLPIWLARLKSLREFLVLP